MSKSTDTHADDRDESVFRDYLLGVRVLEVRSRDAADPHYRFEAPDHEGREFENPDHATLYADVYFDVNGFVEAGTGERGVPPEVIQAGRDTLAAYFLTQRYTDRNWVASFYGKEPDVVERYVDAVRQRASEIREGARERGME